MYFCPNCGGELVFDPASGMLVCGSCMSSFDPATATGMTGAQESHETMSQDMANDVTAAMGTGTAFDMQTEQQYQQQQFAQQQQQGYGMNGMPSNVPQGAVGGMQQGYGAGGMQQGVAGGMQQGYDQQGIAEGTDGSETNAAGDSEQMMRVTIYKCSQCGGEIYSTDVSATGFCSFCGTAQILESRLDSVRKPELVIPFSITKEGCKQSYLGKLKRSFLTPKEFKDPEKLDRFRGIYIPYWFYDYEINGPVNLRGSKSRRRGDYIYTDHFNLTAHVQGQYNGNSFDASSEFDDRISQSIAPFKPEGAKFFSPAFLSGYYADLADVPVETYAAEAQNFVAEDIVSKVSGAFPGYEISETQKKAAGNTLINHCAQKKQRSAMCPVLFLSYRNKDSIAYAVVNGQTGKIAADMPVDKFKFILTALIAAVPIFFLLELLVTMIPKSILGVSAIFAFITMCIYNSNLTTIKKQDEREEDKGLAARKRADGIKEPDEYDKKGRKLLPNQRKSKKNEASPFITVFIILAVIIVGIQVLGMFGSESISLLGIGVVAAGINVGTAGYTLARKSKYKNPLCAIMVLAGVLVTIGLALFKPVSDIYYYIGVIINYASMLVVLIGILNQYNILATRPLPQLARKGGDDRAPGR